MYGLKDEEIRIGDGNQINLQQLCLTIDMLTF